MHIAYHKKFKKAFVRQPKSIQEKFFERLEIFAQDQFHYLLNNHALAGEFLGWRSFNVTGDIRVHYEEIPGGVVLMSIGSHSELY